MNPNEIREAENKGIALVEEPKKVSPVPSPELVWLSAWTAAINRPGGAGYSDNATALADRCLEEYIKRFGQPSPPGNANTP